jgi:hypothetical protein
LRCIEKQAISGYETPIGENCSGILPCSTSKKSATSPAEQPNKGEKLGLLSTAEKETVRTEPKKHFGWGLHGEYQYDPRHCEEWW